MGEAMREQDANIVFSLDIGTRSIIGVVGEVVDGKLHVLAIEKENHGQRSMLDGQIENIGQVARVAKNVIARLEKRTKIRLARVCVAAAGRA
ncbi:MAG: cell division protein FtsA, partial [Oscillibacter sp.]|nr:cell division protein FtsA [Oscillibacter sp.]